MSGKNVVTFVCALIVSIGSVGGAVQPPAVTAAAKYSKLSSELQELAELERTIGVAAAEVYAARRGLVVRDANVRVVVETSAVAAVGRLVAVAGGSVDTTAGELVLARLPVSALTTLAAAGEVKVIRRPRTPAPLQMTSEGVKLIGADVWHSAGKKGGGVKIAILDLGFLGYEQLLGNELPNIPTEHIRSFSGDISGGGIEHGAGVAEIVHDVAPDADLYLVNFSNDVELQNAVDWLIAQRVDVINASWGFFCAGPVDGTGPIDAIAKRAADAGIFWVNAAGNHAQRHWSGAFSDTDSDGWHNFAANEKGNAVHMEAGDSLEVCVEWDDWTAKDQDLDLYVWDAQNNIVTKSINDQSGPTTQEPYEGLSFIADFSGDYAIGIRREHGTRSVKLNMFAYPSGSECAVTSVTAKELGARGILAELREFRDVVLRPSPAGRSLIDAYYAHSREVIRLLLLHPRLGVEASALLKASRPAIRSVVDVRAGRGGATPFVISGEYAARLDRFFEQLIAVASPRLRDHLRQFRERADFALAAGRTADEVWERLLKRAPLDARPAATAAYPTAGYMRYVTASMSLLNPADSPSVFTVGAVQWSTDTLEEFSSQGPTADGRRKPDVAGPDGVCTQTYGDCGGSGFRGTSAASPHVAGAAGLVRQLNPSWSVSDIRNFLTSRVVDLPPAGPDNQTGTGRLALGSPSSSTTPPTGGALPAPTPSAPAGKDAPTWPTFGWSDVTGATSYRLMVSTNAAALPTNPATSTCNNCTINTTSQTTSFIPRMPLSGSTIYYWQVQALAQGKNGTWSTQTSFTTKARRTKSRS